MSMRLRELIRAVRACKTAAEERAVIAKESALIRTAIKEEQEQYRHRNVAKLLFIHMLGYPTHFGQMECLKLIASPHFYEKRIGYLGLSLLLTEQEEVLTLVTNSIKLDLNNPNPFIVGLALTAVGNMASEDICRDLVMDVDKHLRSSNSYLRKKAAVTTIRIFKKVPELVEEFTERITSLLKDRSHGVLLSGVQLMIEVVKLDLRHTQHFVRLVPQLVRLLRNLLTMGYAPDHDVAGITDPFLQVKLLCLLHYLGQANEEASEAMNDILAQVATNTETAKNAGNAILYECVQTIMSIESETGLRVLAINILGRFLLNRDNNIRYVALNTLSKVVTKDAAAVQRHRNTIVDCLKDPDVSIRQRALELIYQLVNETNVTALVREMLNYLVVAPQEHKASICSKIMGVVEQYAPSRRWRLDTLITMLSIAGQVTDDSIPNAMVHYISTSDDLHGYVVHKLFLLLNEDMSQLGLVTTAVWAIGELGDLLLKDQPPLDDDTPAFTAQSPRAVLDLLDRVVRDHTAKAVTRCYVVTALMKLSDRFRGLEGDRLEHLLAAFTSSMQLELQQRASEFVKLLEPSVRDVRPELLARIPALDDAVIKERRGRFAEESEKGSEKSVSSPTRHIVEADLPEVGHATGSKAVLLPVAVGAGASGKSGASNNLLDLDDIFGAGPSAPAANKSTGPTGGNGFSTSGADLLSDIFSTPAPPPPSQPQPMVPATTGVVDFFGTQQQPPAPPQPAMPSYASYGPSQPQTPMPLAPQAYGGPLQSPHAAQGMATPTITAFSKDDLTLTMELSKPNLAELQVSQLLCRFVNAGPAPVTGLLFQCAVPKYVKLEMSAATSTTIPPGKGGIVEQTIRVTNSMRGQKALQLKIKIQYSVNGQQRNELAQVSNFPDGY